MPTAKIIKKPVTRKEFEDLNGSVNKMLDMLEKSMNKPPVTTEQAAEVVKTEKAVEAAGPNKYQVDEEWDTMARDTIGNDYIDHTEVERKGGSVKFTVVIKLEKSNASAEYLQRMKTDRRTRDVSAEGTEGVLQYCKLIKANLARPNK